MKSLQRVQKAVKIFRILWKIAFICSIVGAVCCAIGAIFCGVCAFNETLREMIVREAESFRPKEGVSACVCAAISCGFGIAVSRLNLQFYNAVLAEGTPFTKPLVAKLRRLGVLTIILSLAEAIAIGILTAAMNTRADYSGGSSVALGIAYLLVSLLTDYGADLLKNDGQKQDEPLTGNADANDSNND